MADQCPIITLIPNRDIHVSAYWKNNIVFLYRITRIISPITLLDRLDSYYGQPSVKVRCPSS